MRPTKLTPEVITKLEYYWTLGSEILLSDQDICARVGLNYLTLKKAIQRDQKVTKEDGSRESIVSLRARARASLLIGYLQRHHALLLKADTAGEIANAHNILCWLERKQLPGKFDTQPRQSDKTPGRSGVLKTTVPDRTPEEWYENMKAAQAARATPPPEPPTTTK